MAADRFQLHTQLSAITEIPFQAESRWEETVLGHQSTQPLGMKRALGMFAGRWWQGVKQWVRTDVPDGEQETNTARIQPAITSSIKVVSIKGTPVSTPGRSWSMKS